MARHDIARQAPLRGLGTLGLGILLTLGMGASAAAVPLDDCSTCNGTLTSPTGTVTDPLSGSTIDLTVTHLANGECTTECEQDTGCQLHFKQVIVLGGVGGTITATHGSVYQGQASISTTTSPLLPSGLAADDDLRKVARCGEVQTYNVTVSPI